MTELAIMTNSQFLAMPDDLIAKPIPPDAKIVLKTLRFAIEHNYLDLLTKLVSTFTLEYIYAWQERRKGK